MSLIKKLTPIEPDAIWIVRIIGVTLSIPLILLSIYCFVGIVNINNEMDEMYANTNTEVQPLPKPVRDYVLEKPSKKTFCTKMALGEDRSTIRSNYRCWDEQGEYFRPTWEEFDKIK
tara:strand:+ start:212 stop:562 length:351 start_codon:yes stop_codon:yes gene_type:complete